MGVRVTVNSVPKNRISINNQQKKSIKTVAIAAQAGARTLAELTDVDASDPDNNETLVYDETSGKYVVKVLPNLDGGIF